MAAAPAPTIFNGHADLEVDDLVEIYDSDGTRCGAVVVTEKGNYGPIICRADDLDTTLDEGAVEYERLTFKINGWVAAPYAFFKSGVTKSVNLQKIYYPEMANQTNQDSAPDNTTDSGADSGTDAGTDTSDSANDTVIAAADTNVDSGNEVTGSLGLSEDGVEKDNNLLIYGFLAVCALVTVGSLGYAFRPKFKTKFKRRPKQSDMPTFNYVRPKDLQVKKPDYPAPKSKKKDTKGFKPDLKRMSSDDLKKHFPGAFK
jgi:hypothetical protein